jgi:hypothetical protein
VASNSKDFRMTVKKNKLWVDQGTKLRKVAEYLKGWFKSLLETFTLALIRRKVEMVLHTRQRGRSG